MCESVLYGLPLVIRPTTCWQLDWDEIETNHNLFHALCHTLRVCECAYSLSCKQQQQKRSNMTNMWHCFSLFQSRNLFLLLQVEPIQRSAAAASGLCECVWRRDVRILRSGVCSHIFCVCVGVYSHYVLQPSPSLSLLLKPVASRELLLPCSLPVSTQSPPPGAMDTVQVQK